MSITQLERGTHQTSKDDRRVKLGDSIAVLVYSTDHEETDYGAYTCPSCDEKVANFLDWLRSVAKPSCYRKRKSLGLVLGYDTVEIFIDIEVKVLRGR